MISSYDWSPWKFKVKKDYQKQGVYYSVICDNERVYVFMASDRDELIKARRLRRPSEGILETCHV